MNNPTEELQEICVTCNEPADGSQYEPDKLHSYTDQPCPSCDKFLKEEGYIFVSISDKSNPPDRIRRTGYTWKVEEKEVIDHFGEDSDIVQADNKVVFVRSEEALNLGLLTQEQYDKIEEPPGVNAEGTGES